MKKESRIFNFVKLTLLVGLLFNLFGSIHASENELRKGVKGIWYKPNEAEHPSFEWKAAWIWADETLETDAIFARRSFPLIEIPSKALLRITASSKYQLYINGEYVCRGPARSAPHHQSYDILEISELLKPGKNLIAVRIHHQEGKKSYQNEGRAGLLVQINFAKNEKEIISDAYWRVSPDPSWDNDAPKISRFQQVVNDRVDFRNYLTGWNSLDYDDSGWKNATPLFRKVGWPAPQKNAIAQALTPPWTNLVPREIPYLIEKNLHAKNLIEAVQIDNGKELKPIQLSGNIEIDDTKNIEITSENKSWFLLYDFGEVINGMPQLKIQGEQGTEIQIVTAPFIVDNKFSHKTVDSDFKDKIILSGEVDNWESTYFKPTRYLGIVVENKQPLTIHSAGIHKIQYPFEERGTMSSTDADWVKQYFDATAKTINVCTTDAFTDNYRERRQYVQTGYYAALGNYWIYGDYMLQRRFLIQSAQEQNANGIMPAYAPAASDDFMVILDSNCLWIRNLRNYLLYSGDYKTTRELLPSAQKLMALLHSYTNSLGLIDNPPYPYWLDHALNDRRGANFTLNGMYLGALEDFSEVMNWLDEPGKNEYQKRADLLRQSLQTYLWDNERQLFADALINGKLSEMFSEHANGMALAMNIATKEQAGLVAGQLLVKDKHNYIKRESGITMVTTLSYYLHKGLCANGFTDESFKMFRDRFDKMFKPGTNGTLWEEWWLDGTGRTGKFQGGRTRSDAQTEAAFPPALFAEYLLGVKPTKPGMKEVQIRKTGSKLKNIESNIPTPQGNLFVEWTIEDRSGALELEIPAQVEVKLDLESLGQKDGNQILLNGKEIDQENVLSLREGNYKVEF